jgi:hypothetical protein
MVVGKDMSTQPSRPGEKPGLDENTNAILAETLKTLELDRKTARPADEVFKRILQTPKP